MKISINNKSKRKVLAMKKNYAEPVIKVQTIALQSMIAESVTIVDTDNPPQPASHDRDDLLDGLFD